MLHGDWLDRPRRSRLLFSDVPLWTWRRPRRAPSLTSSPTVSAPRRRRRRGRSCRDRSYVAPLNADEVANIFSQRSINKSTPAFTRQTCFQSLLVSNAVHSRPRPSHTALCIIAVFIAKTIFTFFGPVTWILTQFIPKFNGVISELLLFLICSENFMMTVLTVFKAVL